MVDPYVVLTERGNSYVCHLSPESAHDIMYNLGCVVKGKAFRERKIGKQRKNRGK